MPDDPLESARKVLEAAGVQPAESDFQRMNIFLLAAARTAEEATSPRIETEAQLVQVIGRWPRT